MIKLMEERAEHLPRAVYDLAIRLGANPHSTAQTVRLKQTGRMKSNLETESWMSFTAQQTISTQKCAFDWFAHFGFFGLVSARDALGEGAGQLDVKALGFIPLVKTKRTPALMRGELLRYLGEIAWAPNAIFQNKELRWDISGADQIVVSAGSGETACQIEMSLNSDGQIERIFAADRPRSATPPIMPTPWRGRFSDYRKQDDMWIPMCGEVAWVMDGHELVYWQGQITEWSLIIGKKIQR